MSRRRTVFGVGLGVISLLLVAGAWICGPMSRDRIAGRLSEASRRPISIERGFWLPFANKVVLGDILIGARGSGELPSESVDLTTLGPGDAPTVAATCRKVTLVFATPPKPGEPVEIETAVLEGLTVRSGTALRRPISALLDALEAVQQGSASLAADVEDPRPGRRLRCARVELHDLTIVSPDGTKVSGAEAVLRNVSNRPTLDPPTDFLLVLPRSGDGAMGRGPLSVVGGRIALADGARRPPPAAWPEGITEADFPPDLREPLAALREAVQQGELARGKRPGAFGWSLMRANAGNVRGLFLRVTRAPPKEVLKPVERLADGVADVVRRVADGFRKGLKGLGDDLERFEKDLFGPRDTEQDKAKASDGD